MKLEISDKFIKLIPEDNDDVFMMGRISKNMKCRISRDTRRLKQEITNFEIPIPSVMEMLAEGVILKEEEDE